METKICTKCKIDKPLSEYCRSTRHRQGVQPQCKLCMNVAYTISRNKKKQHYRDVAQRRGQAQAEMFKQLKNTWECSLCGESESCVLDLHHLDPTQKERPVSDMVRTYGWDAIVAEIAKCIVLCSNCHRKVHGDIICLL